MILMYHHVCPLEDIPVEQAPLEGWNYNIVPSAFESQIELFLRAGYQFVSLGDYVDALGQNSESPLIAVTFDDGWVDNLHFAFPILAARQIPSTVFVVSGDMMNVSRERRMTFSDLRKLIDYGVTVGAHTRTHPNLADLPEEWLIDELAGCKADLEDVLGVSVHHLAYPGGRFSRRVVEVAKGAGFTAACSVIPWGVNSPASRFWLYRDVFSDRLNRLSDRLRLNRWSRSLLSWRAARDLHRIMK